MDKQREQFEVKFKHLNLEKKPDAWGVPKYVCSHVEAIWYGWQAAQAAPGEAVAVEPIPDGVYYRLQHDNFYSATGAYGMGKEFYLRWLDRADEFPTTAESALRKQEQQGNG